MADHLPLRSWLVSSSSFSPKQVPGLKVWYKADAITGLADTDAIATFPDSSVNGINLTQGTAGNRPAYRTGIRNGKPVVRGDATDDFMVTAAFAADLVQPNTILWVGRFDDSTTRAAYDGIDTNKRNFLYIDSTPRFVAYAGTDATLVASAAGISTAWNIVTVLYHGAASSIWVNGVKIATANCGTQPLSGVTLGRFAAPNQPIAGDMGELLVYNANVSEGDLGRLHAYLKQKWGI